MQPLPRILIIPDISGEKDVLEVEYAGSEYAESMEYEQSGSICPDGSPVPWRQDWIAITREHLVARISTPAAGTFWVTPL